MRFKILFHLALVLVLCQTLSGSAYAQLKDATFTWQNSKFSKAPPFDVPFRLLIGKAGLKDKNIARLELSYRILPRERKNRHVYPPRHLVDYRPIDRLIKKVLAENTGLFYAEFESGRPSIAERLLAIASGSSTLSRTTRARWEERTDGESTKKSKINAFEVTTILTESSGRSFYDLLLGRKKFEKGTLVDAVFLHDVTLQTLRRFFWFLRIKPVILDSDDEVFDDPEAKKRLKALEYAVEQMRQESGYTMPSGWNFTPDVDAAFEVDPLHPNVTYQFRFNVFEKIDETRQTELSRKLFATYDREITTAFQNASISQDEYTRVITSLLEEIEKVVNLTQLYDQHGDEVSLMDTLENELVAFEDKYIVLDDRVSTAEDQIRTKSLPTISGLLNGTAGQSFLKKVQAWVKDPKLLGDHAQKLWDAPLNPAIASQSTVKMSTVGTIIVDNLPSGVFDSLLVGSADIKGQSVVPTQTDHLGTVELLGTFFQVVNSSAFQLKRSVPAVTGAEKTALQNIIGELEGIVRQVKKKTALQPQLTGLQNAFPDLLRNVLARQPYLYIADRASLDLGGNENAYFSLDVGLGNGPVFEKYFTYQALNLYAVPVNKRADISAYPWGRRQLKRTSLLVGLTSTGIDEEETGDKKLFAAGSLVGGIGYRFHRFVKLNVGVLTFRQVDANPVVQKTRIKSTFFAALSIDINVAKAFKDIGSALGNVFK